MLHPLPSNSCQDHSPPKLPLPSPLNTLQNILSPTLPNTNCNSDHIHETHQSNFLVMEGIERHRNSSSHSHRPAKRPRTSNSGFRMGTPGIGSSSAAGRVGSSTASSSNASTDTVVVPANIILPNLDSEGRRTVIDLTQDSPPSRQPHPSEIIDVDALPDRPSSYFAERDFDLLFSRRRYPRPMGHAPPARPIEPSIYDHGYSPGFSSLFRSHGDPILGNGGRIHDLGGGVSSRQTRGSGVGGVASASARGAVGAVGALGNLYQALSWFRGDSGISGGGNWTIRHSSVDMHFQAPVLDYRLGANGQMDTPPVEDAARQRQEEYKAPPPPREGFTRSPKTDDILVCPSCEHELGQNSEEEGQNTVWLGKCGHCYCGKCAAEIRSLPPRSRKTRAGGPTGNCTICKTNLRGKNLWEVFL